MKGGVYRMLTDILGIERPGKDRAGVILQNNTLLSHSPEEQAQTISL